MKKELKSSWNHLEDIQHVGRVPRRGVSKPVSRQRRHVLVGTLGDVAYKLHEAYERKKTKVNMYDY